MVPHGCDITSKLAKSRHLHWHPGNLRNIVVCNFAIHLVVSANHPITTSLQRTTYQAHEVLHHARSSNKASKMNIHLPAVKSSWENWRKCAIETSRTNSVSCFCQNIHFFRKKMMRDVFCFLASQQNLSIKHDQHAFQIQLASCLPWIQYLFFISHNFANSGDSIGLAWNWLERNISPNLHSFCLLMSFVSRWYRISAKHLLWCLRG